VPLYTFYKETYVGRPPKARVDHVQSDKKQVLK
jgi:hypothetical protein